MPNKKDGDKQTGKKRFRQRFQRWKRFEERKRIKVGKRKEQLQLIIR